MASADSAVETFFKVSTNCLMDFHNRFLCLRDCFPVPSLLPFVEPGFVLSIGPTLSPIEGPNKGPSVCPFAVPSVVPSFIPLAISHISTQKAPIRSQNLRLTQSSKKEHQKLRIFSSLPKTMQSCTGHALATNLFFFLQRGAPAIQQPTQQTGNRQLGDATKNDFHQAKCM